MNPANTHPAPVVPHRPSPVAPAASRHDDPSPDPCELTSGELLAVAGGPGIQNGR